MEVADSYPGCRLGRVYRLRSLGNLQECRLSTMISGRQGKQLVGRFYLFTVHHRIKLGAQLGETSLNLICLTRAKGSFQPLVEDKYVYRRSVGGNRRLLQERT